MKKLLFALIPLIALFFSACAAKGPLYSSMKDQAQIPALGEGKGRVFFYRTMWPGGSSHRPYILVNNTAVGRSLAKGFFWIDFPPGTYEIKTSTTTKREILNLTVSPGQTYYVRFDVRFGIIAGTVYPVPVRWSRGVQEIEECKYSQTGE